jgi:hypothetical protein
VFLDHVKPIVFLPLVYTITTCINLTTYYPFTLYLDTLGFEICVWVDLLSPAFMSYHTSIPSFMMLSCLVVYCESCGLPFVKMLVDCGSGSILWFEQVVDWWSKLGPLGDVVSLARIC